MNSPFEIVYLGLEHPDYFQGFGTSFSRFNRSVYGIGSTIQDAYEDALEQMACCEQAHSVVMPDLPADAPIPSGPQLEEGDERYYHVGIRWVNMSIGEMNPDSED